VYLLFTSYWEEKDIEKDIEKKKNPKKSDYTKQNLVNLYCICLIVWNVYSCHEWDREHTPIGYVRALIETVPKKRVGFTDLAGRWHGNGTRSRYIGFYEGHCFNGCHATSVMELCVVNVHYALGVVIKHGWDTALFEGMSISTSCALTNMYVHVWAGYAYVGGREGEGERGRERGRGKQRDRER
jgi:hypothetical protein